MAHPHRHKAAESSREKFRQITGHLGGGHAHAGASHLKKPGEHGEPKKWSGHHKMHRAEGGKVEGEKPRPRGDRYARGGSVKGPKEVTINIQAAPPTAAAAPPPMPPAPPPAAPPPAPPPPAGGAPGGGAPGGANPMANLGKGLGFARGGSVSDASKGLSHWRKYANRDRTVMAEKRARGGRMTAGAMSGEGRLQKIEMQRRKG